MLTYICVTLTELSLCLSYTIILPTKCTQVYYKRLCTQRSPACCSQSCGHPQRAKKRKIISWKFKQPFFFVDRKGTKLREIGFWRGTCSFAKPVCTLITRYAITTQLTLQFCTAFFSRYLTFRRRNYFFLILAHPVYKMWIIQEPNTLELWNKLHFEEEKTESIYRV